MRHTRFVTAALFLSASLTTVAAFTPALAFGPTHIWSRGFGGPDYDEGATVAVNASGDVFLAASFADTVNFGGADLVGVGSADVLLARYDSNGVHQWSKRLGGAGFDAPNALVLDTSGNLIVVGAFTGTSNFGGSDLTSAGIIDIFMAKYDANGNHIWSRRIGGSSNDYAWDVAVDAAGNIALTGSFQSTVDFGGGNLTSAGDEDIFVASYDANGQYRWAHRVGGSGGDNGWSIAVDSANNVIATGSFRGNANFGGGNLLSAGEEDVFLAKYDGAGNHIWSRRFGAAESDNGYAVATDGTSIVVTGNFLFNVSFGGGDLVSAGGGDIFLAKFDADGAHQWSQRFGGSGSDTGDAIAIDNSGNIGLAGQFQDTVDFGGGDVVSGSGPYMADICVAKYDASGNHVWSGGYGRHNGGNPAIAMDAGGNALLTGSYLGPISFGGPTLPSAGNDDVFLVKFGPDANEPTGVRSSPRSGISISAFPNPFNPSTTIEYAIPSAGRVSITIHDARGALITALADGLKPAGVYRAEWNGRDSKGRAVPSGIYFARVTHSSGTRSYKLVLLK